MQLDAGRGPEGVAMVKSKDKQTHYIRSRPYGLLASENVAAREVVRETVSKALREVL